MTVIEKLERIDKIEQLAKEKHGDYYLAALWGSAQCFLEEKDFVVMERVFGKEV